MPSIKIERLSGPHAEFLYKRPTLNHLLCVIADKAAREDLETLGLKAGQCHIQNHESIGLTRPEWINGKKILADMKLAKFEGTSRKGTIATLLDSDLYQVGSIKGKSKNKSKADKIEEARASIDSDKILTAWNGLGCKAHKNITDGAVWSLIQSYKLYAQGKETPSEINAWAIAYLTKGFAKKVMTDHHRDTNDGTWCADLEFALRPSTYEKVTSSK